MQTTKENKTEARLYVGTYAKYNNGSIAGQWLDLSDYSDRDAFLEACAELHKDESDPELMFQDFEGFPRRFYGESCINEKLWDWLALDDDDKELMEVWLNNCADCNDDSDIDEIREKFQGKFNSLADYVENFFEETGGYERDEKNWFSPINYVDWERMAHDLQTSGDVTTANHNGEVWVFNNN